MLTRRRLLQYLPSLPLLGGCATGSVLSLPGAEDSADESRDHFAELGLRTFINAAGTYTALSGSLMRDEVTSAIRYVARHYVKLDDIQDHVGERIAARLGCEAATVTAGAASALTLGIAWVLCGTDRDKVEQLPDLTGMKQEVILQKAHHVGYVHAVRNCGVKIVYVETREELVAAIGPQTAMLLFINASNFSGQVRDEEFVDIGKRHGIPCFNDCAADVAPVENLWKYTQMGFDLVTFSGGKGLRGPQSAGLLLGRKDLIEVARLHAPPGDNTVGRGMKMNKEEILGMLVALEHFLDRDHEADWQMWETQVQHISESVRSVPGVDGDSRARDRQPRTVTAYTLGPGAGEDQTSGGATSPHRWASVDRDGRWRQRDRYHDVDDEPGRGTDRCATPDTDSPRRGDEILMSVASPTFMDFQPEWSGKGATDAEYEGSRIPQEFLQS